MRELLGRQYELTQLEQHLDQAERGNGNLCLLVGEPGIGKTRLAEELAARAAARGIASSWGRAWDAGGSPAFWPWLQALGGIVGDASGLLSAGSSTSMSPELQFRMFRNVSDALREATARAAHLVVREWLSAMVAGKVVEYDGKRGLFHLPAEHAASLTRAAGPDNFAMFCQYIACLGSVEDAVLDCFHNGGGVPYSKFDKFQILQAEESAMVHDLRLIDGILPLVPGLPERLRAGIDVLEVGCGCGHAANLIAKAFPNSRVTAIDFSEEGIGRARAEADRLGLSNVRFEMADAAKLDARSSYDLVTAFDAIHDQAAPAAVLSAIRRALRPGGVFLCADVAACSHLADNVDHPLAPALYATSTLHCMPVSLAHGGPGLGSMWGEEKAREMIFAAGFPELDVKRIDADIVNNYYIARVPA